MTDLITWIVIFPIITAMFIVITALCIHDHRARRTLG